MHSERRMSNKEIGEALDISESAVSKVLKECFEQGRIQLVFNREGLTPKQISMLQATAAGAGELKRLMARFHKDFAAVVDEPDVRIFDSGSTETTPAAWSARLDAFGRAAAPYVAPLIAASHVVGTSWGETLAAIVRGLDGRFPQAPKRPIHFVPMCGEMLEGPPRKASASNLAYRLDEMVNGGPRHSHSYWLAGVPSRKPRPEPRGLTPEECRAVTRYIHLLPGYRRVFGPDPANGRDPAAQTPLIDRLDMILTSCGPKERPLGYGGVQDLRSAGLTLREARRLLVGDLSGILLKDPAAGHDSPDQVDEINKAWTGAQLIHFRECARKALAGPSGGTVLCGIGANKVDAVIEIVRLGLAVRIVVDFDLAQALSRRL